jgi:hypothetical protein
VSVEENKRNLQCHFDRVLNKKDCGKIGAPFERKLAKARQCGVEECDESLSVRQEYI